MDLPDEEFPGSGNTHVSNNSGEMEWYTPEQIIEAARACFGGTITTDPATNPTAQRWIRAERAFTEADDGLQQRWTGSVWLNPPFAQPLVGQFVDKLIDEVRDGDADEGISITNNATETRWGARLLRECTSICFIEGRVRWVDKAGVQRAGSPLQGQMVAYLGDRPDRFVGAFGAFGSIFRTTP